MGDWRNYIERKRTKYVGQKVLFERKIYTIVDVDMNGVLLIDKKAKHTDTTAVGLEHITIL